MIDDLKEIVYVDFICIYLPILIFKKQTEIFIWNIKAHYMLTQFLF